MQRNVKFVNPERGDLRVLQATSEVRPLEIATDRTVKLSLEQKEAICRSCPTQWFHAYFERCLHPQCGCPRSEAGRHPWSKLKRCPQGHWWCQLPFRVAPAKGRIGRFAVKLPGFHCSSDQCRSVPLIHRLGFTCGQVTARKFSKT